MNFGLLYEANGLQVTICEYYSWEMALKLGLHRSFDNI
jgi:hypothetical protein